MAVLCNARNRTAIEELVHDTYRRCKLQNISRNILERPIRESTVNMSYLGRKALLLLYIVGEHHNVCDNSVTPASSGVEILQLKTARLHHSRLHLVEHNISHKHSTQQVRKEHNCRTQVGHI